MTPYLSEEERLSRYGIVVAMQPLAQTIFSPILGFLTTKFGTKRIGLIASLTYILSNSLYSTLSVFPEDYRYGLLITSRFITGMSSGLVASVRSYLASATFVNERTNQMSIASAFQSVGFLIGPGIQAALTPLECTDINAQDSDKYLSFDLYTSAGWVCVALGVVNFILFLIFQEIDVSQKELEFAKMQEEKNGSRMDQALPKPSIPGVFGCLLVSFILFFNFIIVETLGTPMCVEQLGWTGEETILRFGILMAAMGVVLVFGFATVGPLCKMMKDERKVMILGIIFMFIGRLMIIPIPGNPLPPLIQNSSHIEQFEARNIPCDQSSNQLEPGCELEWCKSTPAVQLWQLFGGIIVGSIGHPYAVSVAQALYSKIIGPRPQGTWMGLITAMGGFARFLGPIFVSYIYTYYGTYLTGGIMTGSTVIALIVILAVYQKLVPIQIQKQSHNPREENTQL